jgi:hypothetical protein
VIGARSDPPFASIVVFGTPGTTTGGLMYRNFNGFAIHPCPLNAAMTPPGAPASNSETGTQFTPNPPVTF